MTNTIPIERVKEPILKCLDETFASVHGIFLDKGTTLYDTLATITASEASQRISPNSATIAAQVDHVRFYLDVLNNYMLTKQSVTSDGREIWETVGEFSDEECQAIKVRLKPSHDQVLSTINSFDKW